MPVITIAGNDTISVEDKREMVKKVSEIVAESYGLPSLSERKHRSSW